MTRDIKQLHPDLQKKILELKEELKQKKLSIGISECIRTVAEQNDLYAKGRTVPGQIVTSARGTSYSSMHQWGTAFDFYLIMDVDGDGQTKDDAFNDSKGDFKKIGNIAQSLGLVWGGAWTSIVDKPHLQLNTYGNSTALIKRLYWTPARYFKCWKLDAPTMPTTAKSSKDEIMYCQYRMNEKFGAQLVCDGEYGPACERAVKKIREQLGWKVGDGKTVTIAMLKQLR